jgi:hypothetical protein
MAVITTANFTKALWPGVNAWYGKAYNEFPVEWDKLFDKNKSKRAFEEDVGVSGFGLAVEKAQGESISYDTEMQGYITRYSHVVYGLGFVVTREAVEDDLYDVVASRKAQALAFSMRQTKEIIGANVYNPANDRGLKIAVKPQSLVISYQNEFEANRIFKTVGRVGTDLNDINAIKEIGMFPGGIIVNHYLTDADAWFIKTNVPHGLKYWARREDDFGMDNDFDTENAKYKATARYSFGATDPRALFGSPGA